MIMLEEIVKRATKNEISFQKPITTQPNRNVQNFRLHMNSFDVQKQAEKASLLSDFYILLAILADIILGLCAGLSIHSLPLLLNHSIQGRKEIGAKSARLNLTSITSAAPSKTPPTVISKRHAIATDPTSSRWQYTIRLSALLGRIAGTSAGATADCSIELSTGFSTSTGLDCLYLDRSHLLAYYPWLKSTGCRKGVVW